MIPQGELDALAQSAASAMHSATGILVGHVCKVDERARRVIFSFKVGVNEITHEIVPLAAFAHESWQRIFDGLVENTLTKQQPNALAKLRAMKLAGETPPEIPPFIDQQGRRHFRMRAEPGHLGITMPSTKH